VNDAEIREALHRKKLHRHHLDSNTLVVDELGLKHGEVRADIAVINGHLAGFEIKSDDDSLRRLTEQVRAYNEVFDRATLVVGTSHTEDVKSMIPCWWGVIEVRSGIRGGVIFETIRTARPNPQVALYSVAQLLWRSEVIELLSLVGVAPKVLRQPRAALYQLLVESVRPTDLRRIVRDCLRSRTSWRRHAKRVPHDGSSQPFAK
jgi:hypothetical protein